MKLLGLKREHFPNGQAFSQKALDEYIAARQQVRKDFLTRYVLSLAIGVVVGFVVLLIIDPSKSFLRVFMSMLAVMISAVIGTRLTGKTLETLREKAMKVNVTRKDLKAAVKNMKNGTIAWTEEQEKLEK